MRTTWARGVAVATLLVLVALLGFAIASGSAGTITLCAVLLVAAAGSTAYVVRSTRA